MLSNGHAGFGERPEETDREQSRHRASGRLYGVISSDRFLVQFLDEGRSRRWKGRFRACEGRRARVAACPGAFRGVADARDRGGSSAVRDLDFGWSGRCGGGPRRVSRAGTVMRWRRRVWPRALAWTAEARQPRARTRLWVMAARVNRAAFAVKTPEGKCASGLLITSALT